MSVDWSSPTWGQPGHNIHESETGSQVADRHDATSGGEH